MKLRLLISLICAVLAPCVPLLADTQIPDATLSGTNTVVSGATFTTNNGSTLTISGALEGTPTGGTLDLGSVTLKVKPPGAGATSRDIALQIKDIAVNVVTWGADPTGTTDCASAITAALALGLPVYFPPGNYKLSSTVTISAGQRVFGAGKRITRIIMDDGVDGFLVGGNDVTIEDMDLGGTSSSHLAGCAIQLGSGYGNYFTANRVTIQYAALGLKNEHGFDASSVQNCHFKGCTVGTTQTTGVDDFLFLETSFDGCTTSGIDVNGGIVHILHGVFGGNATSLRFITNGGKATIDHCWLEGAATTYVDGGGYYNSTINIVDSVFSDGGSTTAVHVSNMHNGQGNISRNGVFNNANWKKVRLATMGGVPSFRSDDENAITDDNGGYSYIVRPYQSYDVVDTLPTPSATSEHMYELNAWNGTIGTVTSRTFIKRQLGGTWFYTAIDGTAAGLDADTDGTLAANSDSKIATQKAVKTYVDGTTTDVARGGTNVTSYTAGDILYATGSTTLTKLPKGSDGQVLTIDPGTHLPVWAASSSTRSVYGAKLSAQLNMNSGNNGAGYVDGSFHDNPDLQIASIPTGTYDVDLWFFMSMQSADTGLKWKLSGSATYTGSTDFEAIENSTTGTETSGFVNGTSVTAAAFSDHLLHYHGQIIVTEPGSFKVQLGTPTAGDSGQLRADTHFELRKVN